LLVSAILKMVPDQWTKRIPMIKINEDSSTTGEDKIMDFYQAQAKGKLVKSGPTPGEKVKPQ
jgi:hypothetical protein